MTLIKDAIHDYIELRPMAEAVLDTPEMQRLRAIRQLSTVQFVYPSANHTRFEHSLGVYHLASQAVDRLEVDADLAERLRAAALVHDVGHGPFGHQTEAAIERHLGRHHDEIGWLLADTELGDVLEARGLDPDAIAETVDGGGPLGELVSGTLDVDRMDYLVRDAHHTGVPYGTIDHARLLHALRVVDGELTFEAGNVATAESALIARTLMNVTVYRHHVSRIAGAMLDRASEQLLTGGDVTAERFARFTDAQLLAAFERYEPTADTARRLQERHLYKRAIWLPHASVPDGIVGLEYDRTRDIEREIAETAGVRSEEVIVDSPAEPHTPESRVRIVGDGERRRLEERSSLVSGLEACSRELWRLGVYAPEAHLESVTEAAAAVLGVEADVVP
ncbi:HD domain-containing protein [Natrarchaeobaculum sulfurireducens]|uniref:DNTP triphosphohydrolase, Archaeal subgroup n=1 Tax=Natrarchaeobaculum sulfurireducens TaxID=2044521 RepID=A0A346PLF1_9EURY|nr:HD domain-containing protein [Natrarchaeobaculum sulfurireducens]AXR80346.1 Putative dNTP triphosphohydrolase, Archaeal subgroup [Natrarchaeobaculum sulfurireducens]